MRVLVDTNVLVSFVTDRNAAQQQDAAQLLERAARGELQVTVHQLVLGELVYVLTNLYRVPPETAAGTVNDLIELPGIDLAHHLSWPLVLDLWPAQVRDFTDACLIAVALRDRTDAIATFDLRLQKEMREQGVAAYP